MIKRELSDRLSMALEPVSLDGVLEVGNPSDKLSVPNKVLNRILYQEVLEEVPVCKEELEYKEFNFNHSKVRGGGFGEVYPLEKDKAGKLIFKCQDDALKEFAKLKLLNKLKEYAQVNSPEALDICFARLHDQKHKMPLILMQYLGDTTIEDALTRQNQSAFENYQTQIERLSKFTDGNWDDHNENGMWFNDEAYIIDVDLINFKGVDFSDIGGID